MNPNMAQSLVSDHIRESRQQATAARRAGAVRHAVPQGRHPRCPAQPPAGAGGMTMAQPATVPARTALGRFGQRVAAIIAECNYAQRRSTILRMAPGRLPGRPGQGSR